MASLRKYLKLMKDHPQLFVNPNGEGIVRIITDPEKIKVLQAEKKKEYKESGKKPEWIDIGVLSEDSWFWVVRDLVEFPDGKIGGYLRVLNRKSLVGRDPGLAFYYAELEEGEPKKPADEAIQKIELVDLAN